MLSALLPFAFPVFFLLAGASARFALQTRSVRSFLAERSARLLVPLVVGMVVVVPVTGYIIALHTPARGRNRSWRTCPPIREWSSTPASP